MLNICCTFTLPSLPDLAFDLVLTTCSFESALLEASVDDAEVDLDAISNEIFSKNGTNIRATFEGILRNKFEIEAGDYYVVADRASENPVAFGRRYICCFAHQLDNCYKWAIRALKA